MSNYPHYSNTASYPAHSLPSSSSSLYTSSPTPSPTCYPAPSSPSPPDHMSQYAYYQQPVAYAPGPAQLAPAPSSYGGCKSCLRCVPPQSD